MLLVFGQFFYFCTADYSGATAASRAQIMLSKMNFTEKLAMLHGISGPYVGNVAGNSRLGIPPISMNDGPQG